MSAIYPSFIVALFIAFQIQTHIKIKKNINISFHIFFRCPIQKKKKKRKKLIPLVIGEGEGGGVGVGVVFSEIVLHVIVVEYHVQLLVHGMSKLNNLAQASFDLIDAGHQ